MKPTQPRSSHRRRVPPAPTRDVFAIFDLVFKRLIRLSSRAVTALINGLFDTTYPPDAIIEYPNTETVGAGLKRRLSDIFIKINGVIYHIEIQSAVDDAIIIRVFEAGFGYGRDEKQFDADGIRVIRFPRPRVIQIQGAMQNPQILRLIFPDGTSYDYKVDVLNLQQWTVKELGEKGLALLLPFAVLRLRRQVEAAKTGAERAAVAVVMGGLLDGLLREVAGCEKRGLIERQDTRAILDWLDKLYDAIYSRYDELAKEAGKVSDGIKLYSEILVEEARKEAWREARKETREEISLATAKRFLAMGVSPEKVAKGTGLSLAKVRALAESAARPAARRARRTARA